MKVLNLRCANEHRFEGWFGSVEDFQSQCERGLIECPLCADHVITRLPSAPRLNVSGAREELSSSSAGSSGSASGARAGSASKQGSIAPGAGSATSADTSITAATAEQMQAQWMQAVKQAIATTEDVGQHFAEEARRIHYGEAEERAIRGSTSLEEARSLREEGIEVVSLPIPVALKGSIQ